jgi:ligand-binding SRPBCC domain-containing protein
MISLWTDTVILAPAERCFDLARSVDLHAASASVIQGKALAGRTSGLSALGDRTTWSARFFGMRFSLTTRITAFDRPRSFSDVICAGLFTHFGHVYTFQPTGVGRTLMTDEFSFQSPFGILGAAFDTLILRRRMRTVMDSRARCVKRVAESEEWRTYLTQEGTA